MTEEEVAESFGRLLGLTEDEEEEDEGAGAGQQEYSTHGICKSDGM